MRPGALPLPDVFFGRGWGGGERVEASAMEQEQYIRCMLYCRYTIHVLREGFPRNAPLIVEHA